jgi:hypothetical protein
VPSPTPDGAPRGSRFPARPDCSLLRSSGSVRPTSRHGAPALRGARGDDPRWRASPPASCSPTPPGPAAHVLGSAPARELRDLAHGRRARPRADGNRDAAARGIALTPEDAIHIATRPDVRAQAPRRTWLPHELMVDGTDVVDRDSELRVPLVDAFFLPIFVSGVRVFELLPDAEHNPRQQIGNTVMRRESWNVAAADILSTPRTCRPSPASARCRGACSPRSPLERKPMYLDTESPSSGASSTARRARPRPQTPRPASASARCSPGRTTAGCMIRRQPLRRGAAPRGDRPHAHLARPRGSSR